LSCAIPLGAAKAPPTLPPGADAFRGDSEETQLGSIFTRIASFDNPSKDVNEPFESVAKKSEWFSLPTGLSCKESSFVAEHHRRKRLAVTLDDKSPIYKRTLLSGETSAVSAQAL